MIIHRVARLSSGFLDLASLVPNAGGYEPDPVQRLRNTRCEIGIKRLPPIDVESFFARVPREYQPIRAEAVSYWGRYGQFRLMDSCPMLLAT